MKRILVSACLVGEPVRFDGRSKLVEDPRLSAWRAEGRLVPFCPEVEGGLPVPRIPAEIQGDRVMDAEGIDRTEAFRRGATLALEAARREGCVFALLKEGSPSCGVNRIYDGTFTGTSRTGQGRTAALLKEADIQVFAETQLTELEQALGSVERRGESLGPGQPD